MSEKPETAQIVKSGRKPWKVDLKWLCGILAVMFLMVSLTSLALYRVASNPQVEKLSKTGLASKGFLNSMLPKELQGKTKGTPGQSDFRINVKGKWYKPEQLDKMPESEFKKLFGGKAIEDFANPTGQAFMEKLGISGMDGSGADLEKALSGGDAGKLGKQMFGNAMNQAIIPALGNALAGPVEGVSMTIFLATLIPALLFLFLMVVFSYRWGHLVSFALVLFLSALPVFLVATLFKILGSANAAAAPKTPGGDPFSGALSFVNVLADSNFALFLGIIIFCFLLVGLAALGGIIGRAAAGPKVTPKPA